MFECTKCGFVDHIQDAYQNGKITQPLLCTVCQGRPWHGHFPRSREISGAYKINDPGLKLDGQ